jgi:hypothetical protein
MDTIASTSHQHDASEFACTYSFRPSTFLRGNYTLSNSTGIAYTKSMEGLFIKSHHMYLQAPQRTHLYKTKPKMMSKDLNIKKPNTVPKVVHELVHEIYPRSGYRININGIIVTFKVMYGEGGAIEITAHAKHSALEDQVLHLVRDKRRSEGTIHVNTEIFSSTDKVVGGSDKDNDLKGLLLLAALTLMDVR